MCVYTLNQHYDAFLAAREEHAIRGGIAAVDRFVEREQVAPYIAQDHAIDELTERFAFGDREAVYVADSSEVWRAGSHQDDELKIADAILLHMESAVEHHNQRSTELAIRLSLTMREWPSGGHTC